MSVHGEFQRYLEAVAEALRASEIAEHRLTAAEADRIAHSTDQTLESRASSVLDDPLRADQARAAWPPEATDAAERLVAISQIILGR